MDSYAHIATLEEIERNDFNLNISRYIETIGKLEVANVAAAVGNLRKAEHARAKAEEVMNGFLKELGYE